MSRKALQRDLRHDAEPEKFGSAMLRCEGYSPDCSHYGRCMLGGTCFASPGHLVAARMIEALVKPDAGTHYAYLRRCAEMLREGHILL